MIKSLKEGYFIVFIRKKHMLIFGVIAFMKLQNDTSTTVKQ